MTTPVWQPGTQYSPGDIVRPASLGQVTQVPPENASFDDGLTGWIQSSEFGTGTWSTTSSSTFDGPFAANWAANPGGGLKRSGVRGILQNEFLAPVRPGLVINGSCRVSRYTAPDDQTLEHGGCRIYWYDENMDQLSFSLGNSQPPTSETLYQGLVRGSSAGGWIQALIAGTAPAGAAFAQFAVVADDTNNFGQVAIDDCRWDYTFQGVPDGLVFQAVQAATGYSGASEPTWPIVNGQTVVDNEVTWEAIFVSRVIWEASPILVSGQYEPNFPEEINATVMDGTIAWRALDSRVTDPRCPNSAVVAIAASKIFATDDDIIVFSATTNPLDWSSEQDAGFLPFGLQTHGATPCAALGLYRGNLVAFNSEGYQMWQVDEDPANMALLDASPVDCEFPKSVQPVSNDLAFLTAQGIRNISIAGASTNLQAGFFGKQIDPLVQEAVRNLGTTLIAGEEPIGLFWPGAGQYWLIFGTTAFVLTMNGGSKDQAWSRYEFPEPIDSWAILGTDLHLRAGDLVWKVSDEAVFDDEDGGTPGTGGGANIPFEGEIVWPYLDLGQLGVEKQMEGFDLVCTGTVDVQFGYSQSDDSLVTEAYTLTGDTLPGTMVPMPLSGPSFQLRLTFDAGQAWEWNAASLYFLGDQERS